MAEAPSASSSSNPTTNTSAGPVVPPSFTAFGQAVVSQPLLASHSTLAPLQPQARQQPFPFFQLPPEIRNMIYGYMLTSPEPIIPHHTLPIPLWYFEVQDARKAAGPLYDPLPTVLCLSRQFAREASAVFWPTNTFQLDLTHHRLWLTRIGRANSWIIKRLHVKCFRDFVSDEDFAAWTRKLVMMGNTVRKRCPGMTELDFRFGFLRTEAGEELPASQCLRCFVDNEDIRRAWKLKRWEKLRRVTVYIHEEWHVTAYVARMLQELVGRMKRGVMVEGIHVATVNSYRLPGAPPDMNQHLHEDQERKFFEGWRTRETGTVATQILPWERPVGWPTVYRRGHEQNVDEA